MNLPDIQLDPRSEYELWEQAANHAFNVSGGTLNNFSPADPLSFLIEGQVYAGAELLWYLNKLPSKLLAQWLAAWGLTVSAGSKATGMISVTFTGVLPATLTIPVGFMVSGFGVTYQTTQTVTAGVGLTEVLVPVEAVETGEAGNLPPYSITQIATPIAFVRSVYNVNPMTGGSDTQTDEEAIALFVQTARDGVVTSRADIIRSTQDYLGAGWVVRLLLDVDPVTGLQAQGTLAVLIDNAAYRVVSIGTLAGLQTHLDAVCPVNISPWVSALGRSLARVRVAIYTQPDADPQLVADNFYQELLTQTDLLTWDYERIAPLAYRSGGSLGSISINEVPVFTQPANMRIHLDYLEVRCVDPSGNEQLFLYGNGDPI